MKKHSIVGLTLGFLFTTIVAQAHATDWYVPTERRLYPGDALAASEAFLKDHQDTLQLRGIDLTAYEHINLDSLHTLRFEQRYSGVPVIGSSLALRIGSDGHVRVVASHLTRNLTVSPIPDVDIMLAQTLVRQSVGSDVLFGDTQLGIDTSWDGGVLVWQVDAMFAMGMRRFLVDAHSGEIRAEFPLAKDVKARVYPVNSLKGKVQDLDVPNITTSNPQLLNAYGGSLSVYQFVSGDFSSNPNAISVKQALNPNSGSDYLYDPPSDPTSTTDSFAQVSAFYHLDRMHDFFANTLGVDMSASKWTMAGIVNYTPGGKPLDNAFFTPWTGQGKQNALFFGQGTSLDYTIDSDVCLHEFTHYISKNALKFTTSKYFESDKYGIIFMPDALDEGTADYFSSSVNNDAIVAEQALGAKARDLSDNSGKCPDSMGGEPHDDGRLVGSSSWSIRSVIGKQDADKVVWGSMTLLPPSATFQDFAQGILQSAKDLSLDSQKQLAISNALEAQGMTDCGRVLDIYPNQPRKTSLIGLNYVSQKLVKYTCSQLASYDISLTGIFQFKYTPSPSDTTVTFGVSLSPADSSANWDIYVRQGAEVDFTKDSNGFPTATSYNYAKKGIKGTSGQVVVNKTSAPPLNNATPLYVALAYRNCATAAATVTVESDGTGGAGGDGGTDGTAGSSGSGGSAGSAGTGGSAGSAGSSGSGGAAGSAGTGGSAGSAGSAGSSGSGGSGGSSGSAGAAGVQVDAGGAENDSGADSSTVPASAPDSDSSSGCSCNLSAPKEHSATAVAGLLLALALRRRKRSAR